MDWQLDKSKSWGQSWRYNLNSTANPAHLVHFSGKMGWIGTAVYLAGSSKMAPQDFDFFNCHVFQLFI
jgi:hypothetical protein